MTVQLPLQIDAIKNDRSITLPERARRIEAIIDEFNSPANQNRDPLESNTQSRLGSRTTNI